MKIVLQYTSSFINLYLIYCSSLKHILLNFIEQSIYSIFSLAYNYMWVLKIWQGREGAIGTILQKVSQYFVSKQNFYYSISDRLLICYKLHWIYLFFDIVIQYNGSSYSVTYVNGTSAPEKGPAFPWWAILIIVLVAVAILLLLVILIIIVVFKWYETIKVQFIKSKIKITDFRVILIGLY